MTEVGVELFQSFGQYTCSSACVVVYEASAKTVGALGSGKSLGWLAKTPRRSKVGRTKTKKVRSRCVYLHVSMEAGIYKVCGSLVYMSMPIRYHSLQKRH